ncbi:MAG: beta-ketoacyl-[acyl-carrier-protein] synthase family protein [Phycisphaerales bacterium]|nr:MAG: beta-ketoacyl-[acyl-carrier-protein] synthase family protein [Phycisphaerales bacterium]
MSRQRRVVVTGIGLATPIGIGAEAYWEALLQKKRGIRAIESFDPSQMAARIGGALPPHNMADYIPKTYRKNNKVMSDDTRIAVVCAHQAALNAGLNTACLIARGEAKGGSNVDPTGFGANIGAGLICADLPELAGALSTAADPATGRFSHARWGREGMTNLTPLWLLKFLPNMLACHVTIVHDAQAPSNTITCGEASSHLAIGEAFRTIARGAADVVICGGAESKMNPMALARPLLFGWLNTADNDRPHHACRPFASDGAGMVASEGGGLAILESLDHARRRGARIYAEVVGFGAAANTHDWRSPDPSGSPVRLAIEAALKDAGVGPAALGLAVPFGCAVPAFDASESLGWRDACGSRLEQVRAVATKGLIGVNGAGSGAIDFATAVLALYRNTVPPSANTHRTHDGCPFRFVQGDPVDANAEYAVTTAFALSGSQTAALVVRKFEE